MATQSYQSYGFGTTVPLSFDEAVARVTEALLPCNVVIRELPVEGEKPQTRVEIADPVAMLGIVQRPEMQDLAAEAKERLQRVIAAIASA